MSAVGALMIAGSALALTAAAASAEMRCNYCSELNEDGGRDEIVVRVTLYDPNYGPVQFHSGIIVGYW
jgi:hypothetical protein